MDKKYIYVNTGKPIQFKKFTSLKKPTGWVRLDLLKKKLNEDKNYKKQFTKSEIEKILKYK